MSPKIGEPCDPTMPVAILWCEDHGIIGVQVKPHSSSTRGGICTYSEAWGRFCCKDATATRIMATDEQIGRMLNREPA